VLYILHAPQCGNPHGRYQSQTLQLDEIDGFMADFSAFLTNDGRHDLWLFSPGSDATLVWDRHNLIYAYGPLEQFRFVLKEGFRETEVEDPLYPHAHLYHAEYDESERKILRYFQWSKTPLLEADEQFQDFPTAT
jgi:hypothetical protein